MLRVAPTITNHRLGVSCIHLTGICEAATPDQLCEVRKLMRAFIEWHRERHHDQVDLIDRYFDPVGFEAELGSLPGKNAPPKGRLLLALHEGRPAGCIAMRDLGGDACEMKRMFVDPEFHGKGVGRDLVKAIVQSAKDIGYAIMRLDTGSKQIEAQTLYRRMGFRIVPPYYELPADLRNWLVFMELELKRVEPNQSSQPTRASGPRG